MKNLKRISLATLVLVMVLSAVLAIPASAVQDIEYFSSPCGVSTFSGTAYSYMSSDGSSANAYTQFSHPENYHSTATTVHVSAKFWWYPSGSSQANYRTTTRINTASGDVTAKASVNSAEIPGLIFSVESTHTLTSVCNGITKPQQTKWLCVGEPAMK